jgi:hypothetical protein
VDVVALVMLSFRLRTGLVVVIPRDLGKTYHAVCEACWQKPPGGQEAGSKPREQITLTECSHLNVGVGV